MDVNLRNPLASITLKTIPARMTHDKHFVHGFPILSNDVQKCVDTIELIFGPGSSTREYSRYNALIGAIENQVATVKVNL